MSTMAERTRMSGAERREQVLAAATRAFATGGYAGTSTDQVAREAGVSQPYVVRMFGTKQELFREVFARVTERVIETVRAAASDAVDPPAALRAAYAGLAADRDPLLVMLHGVVEGGDPEVGALARRTLLDLYRVARDVPGGTPQEARDVLAHGMLITVLVAVSVADGPDDGADLRELVECALGPDGETLLRPPQRAGSERTADDGAALLVGTSR